MRPRRHGEPRAHDRSRNPGRTAPTTAIQSLLAVQMIGAQRAAMTYLRRAILLGQPVEAVDHQLNRAIRLMRMFTEPPSGRMSESRQPPAASPRALRWRRTR